MPLYSANILAQLFASSPLLHISLILPLIVIYVIL